MSEHATAASTRPRISVVIITKNEARNIVACLQSVSWADEIIVLDSNSSDATVQLAEGLGARVVQTEWLGYGQTKQRAVEMAAGPWILSLDADERVTPELASEVAQAAQGNDVNAYAIPRLTWFVDRWIRHSGWYPGYVVRLFRRDSGHFSAARVHESVVVEGAVKRLREPLLHYSFNSLDEYHARQRAYVPLAAEEMHAAGKSAGVWRLFVHPAANFLKCYLFRLGFLDGLAGWRIAIHSSAYVFRKYATLRAFQRSS